MARANRRGTRRLLFYPAANLPYDGGLAVQLTHLLVTESQAGVQLAVAEGGGVIQAIAVDHDDTQPGG